MSPENSRSVQYALVYYKFQNEEHAIVNTPHKNLNISTPYTCTNLSTHQRMTEVVREYKPSAAFDMHSTQAAPQPLCVLATNVQLKQLQLCCTNPILTCRVLAMTENLHLQNPSLMLFQMPFIHIALLHCYLKLQALNLDDTGLPRVVAPKGL